MRISRTIAAVAAVAMLATACASDEEAADEPAAEDTTDDAAEEEPAEEEPAEEEPAEALTGTVSGAGSSTVLPVAEYILEIYLDAQPDVDASYTSVGSGGGFERLCETGDVGFSGSSRQIKDSEAQACEDNGYPIIELQFGVDALTLVTSPETDWVECMTTDDIIEVFGPEGGNSLTWDQVIDGAPAEPVDIYAPDTDSGTYGFMVEDIMGLEESTQDYASSANDDIIVQGIKSGPGTWGYFGYAYYAANEDGLKAIEHENADGNCVAPSVETAESGEYALTRPLYIYVREDLVAEDPALADLTTFFLDNATEGVEFVQYVPAPGILADSVDRLAAAIG